LFAPFTLCAVAGYLRVELAKAALPKIPFDAMIALCARENSS
jgi:hypothetical protein